ncbi:MAG: DNA/RNA nuclease SfsA [Clostridia bacterium]|nr:DNA/RNA nuclease SfsA [Clostridia bacterium]
MKYNNIVEGVFISRPNRFIALVEIEGKEETVHVKNTGRCRELLLPGAKVYLQRSDNPARRTAYDLISVEKATERGNVLINMDSQVVNDVAGEYLAKLFPRATIKREVKYNSSRFDFYIEDGEKKIFVEAKGVTLEHNGTASFPDAPTERGVKHIYELCSALDEGYSCCVLFIIQMKGISHLVPNDATHREFGDALRYAHKKGVKIISVDCIIGRDEILFDKEIEVIL